MSTAEKFRQDLDRFRDSVAEKYGASNRHLKTSQHHADGFDECKELLILAVQALEMYAMTNETFPEYGDVARETLTQIQEKIGARK